VKRRVLHDELQGLLLKMLLDGTIAPGQNLSIDGIARDLDVSPTPVREALVHLEHTGLAARSPLRGYKVSPPLTVEQIAQLIDAHRIVELGALGIALKDRESLLPELLESHEHQTGVVDALDSEGEDALHSGIDSYREYLAADWAFHLSIMRHSHNHYLIEMAASLDSHVHRLRQTFGHGITDARDACAEQGRILAAIELGDARAAIKAMSTHLKGVRTRSLADARRSD